MEWLMILMPVALLALGFPIFVILLSSAAVALVLYLDVSLTQLHSAMFGSIDMFALIAIPFFIFAGELMGRGGISRRIVDWAMAIFGGVRGGLALTTVGTCTVFGAVSGSSPATVAAVGKLLYTPLRSNGYSERFASGLLASSGAIAVVIPPSISMILYGAAAQQSVALLFVAGIVPGLLMALTMGAYILVVASGEGLRGARFSWRRLAGASRAGVWAFGTPVIILGGIYAGVFSPTEAAGVACVYAIGVTRFVYRDVSWRLLWRVGVDSMLLTAQVLIIVAAAGVFSWLLTVGGVPQSMVGYIAGLDVRPWVVLIAINVLLLIVGCLLDPGSAVLVLAPLLVPIVTALGIDPIHFGIVMTMNLAIGMFTPPFGLNIFVAQAVFRAPLSSIYPGLIPFIAVNIATLALVTYVPSLSLYLTRFIG